MEQRDTLLFTFVFSLVNNAIITNQLCKEWGAVAIKGESVTLTNACV